MRATQSYRALRQEIEQQQRATLAERRRVLRDFLASLPPNERGAARKIKHLERAK